jgi:hypothetical protein
LSDKQDAILEAIKFEVASGRSFKEAVKVVMESKRFNHMTIRRVAEKLKVEMGTIHNKSM